MCTHLQKQILATSMNLSIKSTTMHSYKQGRLPFIYTAIPSHWPGGAHYSYPRPRCSLGALGHQQREEAPSHGAGAVDRQRHPRQQGGREATGATRSRGGTALVGPWKAGRPAGGRCVGPSRRTALSPSQASCTHEHTYTRTHARTHARTHTQRDGSCLSQRRHRSPLLGPRVAPIRCKGHGHVIAGCRCRNGCRRR